jgi:hypothetical protein
VTPRPAFQRSAFRSLGPAVAAGQASKSAAARLAAEPAVERSAASLPSAKGGWGAALSPFAALSLGPAEAANNGLGEDAAQPCPTWLLCKVHLGSPDPPFCNLHRPQVVMQRHRRATQAAASGRARRW